MVLSSNIKGMLYALSGYSLFAVGDAVIKSLGDRGFEAVEIAFFLNMFYLPFLVLLSPLIGGIKATLRTENLGFHVLRSIISVAIFMIVITAFTTIGLAMTYTLIFCAPFMATLLSVIFLKDKIHWHRWLSILLGFAGVLIVLRPGLEPLEPAAYGLIFAAFLIACNHMLARKIGGDEPLMAFSLFGTIIALQVFGVLVFWDGAATIPAGMDWFYFFVVACFHTGGILFTAKAFSSTETALVAPFHYVQLLWGTAFGIFFFATTPDLWTGIGALIIVLSGIYMIYRESVKKQEITTGITSHGGMEQD